MLLQLPVQRNGAEQKRAGTRQESTQTNGRCQRVQRHWLLVWMIHDLNVMREMWKCMIYISYDKL